MQLTPAQLVQKFYHEVWNNADEATAHEILHPQFRFRASLGPELEGPDEFCDYMRSIHLALANYRCTIDELIESSAKAAARMRFAGLHRGLFFGVAPTGRTVTWCGAAFFTTEQSRITHLWVLGDVDAVKRQLGTGPTASF